MEETTQATNGGYNKRPLWQWLVIYVILGAAVYGAIYYFFLNKNGGYNYNKSSMQYSSPSPSQAAPSSGVMSNETTVNLKPVNGSNESGTATLTGENGLTKVIVTLTGYTKDIEQPAHIHLGACPGVGAVKYPLTAVVNGTSATTLPITLAQLKKELPLAINVHKSATEVSVYTSCGPLTIQ